MAYNSIVIRLELTRVSFGDVASAIGKAGGDIISIDVISSGVESSVRDISIEVSDTPVVLRLKRVWQRNWIYRFFTMISTVPLSLSLQGC